MDFRDYTYVHAIASNSTISRAAEQLYISQPSLSKFLQNLEEQIHTPLFTRINKRMVPTYAGEQFLKTGEQIFLLQSHLDNTLNEISHSEAGRLTVAVTATRGYYILPEILPQFKKLHPKFHVEILERSFSEIDQLLHDHLTDFAIYANTSRNPEFRYQHVNWEEVVVCLPHDTPYLKYAVSRPGFRHPWIDLSLLKNELFFLNDESKWKIGRISRELFRESQIDPEITTFRSLESCLALAARGVGVTFSFDICETFFRNYVEPPVYLAVGNESHRAEFVVAMCRGFELNRAAMDFIEILCRTCGDESALPR